MNDEIEKLIKEADRRCSETRAVYDQILVQLVIDQCCSKLLEMDSKARGDHNFYKHAALEIKKHFGD